jgi:hypothetical protein
MEIKRHRRPGCLAIVAGAWLVLLLGWLVWLGREILGPAEASGQVMLFGAVRPQPTKCLIFLFWQESGLLFFSAAVMWHGETGNLCINLVVMAGRSEYLHFFSY